jgi:hypothetical protein
MFTEEEFYRIATELCMERGILTINGFSLEVAQELNTRVAKHFDEMRERGEILSYAMVAMPDDENTMHVEIRCDLPGKIGNIETTMGVGVIEDGK